AGFFGAARDDRRTNRNLGGANGSPLLVSYDDSDSALFCGDLRTPGTPHEPEHQANNSDLQQTRKRTSHCDLLIYSVFLGDSAQSLDLHRKHTRTHRSPANFMLTTRLTTKLRFPTFPPQFSVES